MTRGKPYVKETFQKDSDNLSLETANDDELCDENIISKKQNKKRSKARIIRNVWFNREKDPETLL